MSNQFREERDRDVLAVLDVGRLMQAPSQRGVSDTPCTRLDIALDALAALGAVADQGGDRLGALTFDDQVRRRIMPRRRGGATVVRALFDVEASAADSDFRRCFETVRAAKRSLVVVFTDLIDAAAARDLLDGAAVLCRSHAVIVASSVDPTEADWFSAEPADVFEVYRAAALADLAAQRDDVARRLGHVGVVVVQAEPTRFAAAVVSAYLRLKARARL